MAGYVEGMEISVFGRLKSIYSTYKKMNRKRVPANFIWDARALRVVVNDKNGALEKEAEESCYQLVQVMLR